MYCPLLGMQHIRTEVEIMTTIWLKLSYKPCGTGLNHEYASIRNTPLFHIISNLTIHVLGYGTVMGTMETV